MYSVSSLILSPYRSPVLVPLKKRVKATLSDFRKNAVKFVNNIFKPVGINLGSGPWFRFRWVAVDAVHGEKTFRVGSDTHLPFEDQSIKYVFSSHFFEHVTDEDALNLFSECFRILSRDGVLRISVPDFEKCLDAYARNDHRFFDDSWGMSMRYENWLHHGVADSIENKILYSFASYKNMDLYVDFPEWKTNPDYYCGPPKLNAEIIKEMVATREIGRISSFFVSQVPIDRRLASLGHINWWTLEKLTSILSGIGFQTIVRSEFRQSSVKEMRSVDFDNRREMSLFVEAIKKG